MQANTLFMPGNGKWRFSAITDTRSNQIQTDTDTASDRYTDTGTDKQIDGHTDRQRNRQPHR